MEPPEKTPPEGAPKPPEALRDAPRDGKKDENKLTDEQLRVMYDSGDLLTRDRNEEIVRQRLDREREQAKADAEEARKKAEAEGQRKALADQEKYKELSEAQAGEIAAKDAEIAKLKASEQRANDLAERLTKLVDSRLQGLAQPYQDLLGKMPVEERADWLEANTELLGSSDGKPAGSPPSPEPARRDNGKVKDEAAKQARADMRRGAGSSI